MLMSSKATNADSVVISMNPLASYFSIKIPMKLARMARKYVTMTTVLVRPLAARVFRLLFRGCSLMLVRAPWPGKNRGSPIQFLS